MAQSETLSFRVSPRVKRQWAELCEAKNIPQVTAFEAVVRFMAQQDDVGQSIVLGQLKPTPELVRLALSRAGKK